MSPRIDVDPGNQTITGNSTVRSAGASLVVTIPPKIVETLSFERREDVEIKGDRETGHITIRHVTPDSREPHESPLIHHGSFRRSGTSTVITVPSVLVDVLDIEEGEDVEVEGDWGEDLITIRRLSQMA